MHQNDLSTSHPQQDFDHLVQAEDAFQGWRKTQPERDGQRLRPAATFPYIRAPRTPEEEATEVQRQNAALAAESNSAKREAVLNRKF